MSPLVVAPDVSAWWADGQTFVGSRIAGTQFLVHDLKVIEVLRRFATARDRDSVIRQYADDHRVAAWVEAFVESGFLVVADVSDLLVHWDPSALQFHRASRGLAAPRVADESGTVAIQRQDFVVQFEPPVVGAERAFIEVLAKRQSRREWGAGSLTRATFSSLLWLAASDRERGPAPATTTYRAYPSGGGIYSLELYPFLADGAVDDVDCGVYRYCPREHQLERMSNDPNLVDQVLAAAGRATGGRPPPIVLVITSQLRRQADEYGARAYSLILKEVGGLFQTLYLVSEFLGLAACALGGGVPDSIHEVATGTSRWKEPIVGEFAVGPL